MILSKLHKGLGPMGTKKCVVLLILVVLANIFLSSNVYAIKTEESKEGVITLEEFPREPIHLGGEWEFYWKKLYSPRDFQEKGFNSDPVMVYLPHGSDGFDLDGEVLSSTGFATYRLQIQFPPEELGTTKFMYIPSISSASKLWVNGEVKATSGVVGTSRETMEPESMPKIIQFRVDSLTTEIVIQASNYYQRKAGIHELILLGEFEDIFQYQNKKLLFRAIIVTSLVIMGLYHLALFAFRRNEYSLIYFGLLCIFIAVRAILLEEDLAAHVVPFLNWEVRNKIEYLGASFGSLFLTLFAYTQFSEDMNKGMRNLTILVTSLVSLFIILTPSIIFTKWMSLLLLLTTCIFIYLMYVFIIAFKRKREGSFLNLLAMVFLFLAAINDVSYFSSLVGTMELTSVGMLFFLFTQSVIISKRSAVAFSKSEQLSEELLALNTSLEQKVESRTLELNQSNQQLQLVNGKLKEAHQLRTKLISNIAHEIGAPLTSIQAYSKGMIDGVIQKEDKYIQLVYEKGLFLSQLLNDLRAMTDMETKSIKYEMKKVCIIEFCQRLYEQFKLELSKHGIQFDFINKLPSGKSLFVQMDPMRIEQVIINLITNAVRFVPVDGKIAMKLEMGEQDSIKITIMDNGEGISPEELDLIFNRYYSSQKSGKEHIGSGLGLSISKDIVEYHHGSISVKSKVGDGSCFSFALPYIQGNNTEDSDLEKEK